MLPHVIPTKVASVPLDLVVSVFFRFSILSRISPLHGEATYKHARKDTKSAPSVRLVSKRSYLKKCTQRH